MYLIITTTPESLNSALDETPEEAECIGSRSGIVWVFVLKTDLNRMGLARNSLDNHGRSALTLLEERTC